MIAIRSALLLALIALNFSGFTQPDTLFAERMINVEQPIQVLSATSDPDDDRLYIVGHLGKIWIFEDGQLMEEPFLDLSETGWDILNYGNSSEQGINGMAFSPDFETSGIFYLTYNGVRPDGTGQEIEQRLMCFQRDAENPDSTDPDVWFELMEFDEGDDPETGHNGGEIAFGPDGHFYVSVGDGGSTGTGAPGGGSNGDDHGEIGNGQDLTTFLGKILRIDVHGMAPYTIPEDNPFVDNPDALDEIWSYGFRNPWRWSFDRVTGDMWIGDVGEVDWEEVNFEPAGSEGGVNYGWRLMEGTHCYEPVVDCDTDGLTTQPIWDYPHTEGECSVIGGVVYRGDLIPTLKGYYIYSDFCGFFEEKFWLLWKDGNTWQHKPVWVDVPGGFTPWQENRFGFAQDNKDEVYICTTLAVYKILQDPADSGNSTKVSIHPYPNPSQSSVKFQVPEGVIVDGIELVSSDGRVAGYPEFTSSSGVITFSVDGIAAGIYRMRVPCNQGESVSYGNIMIQRP